MPIVNSEIVYRLSGGATQTDPNLSLGGAKSSNIATASLLDNVTSAQAAAGSIEYRCFYVHNANATANDMLAAVVWLQATALGASTAFALAVGTSAVNAQEQGPVASEITAPTGVTWVTNATTEGTAIPLGNIPPGQHRAVWVRRTVTGGAAVFAATATLRVKCDTLA